MAPAPAGGLGKRPVRASLERGKARPGSLGRAGAGAGLGGTGGAPGA